MLSPANSDGTDDLDPELFEEAIARRCGNLTPDASKEVCLSAKEVLSDQLTGELSLAHYERAFEHAYLMRVRRRIDLGGEFRNNQGDNHADV